MVTFEFALDTVMQLPQFEREDLIEIIRKRQIEQWRQETANYYNELKEEIKKGNLKSMTADEAIKELHDYLDSEE